MKKKILFLYALIACHSAFSMDARESPLYLYREVKQELTTLSQELNEQQRQYHKTLNRNLLRYMALSWTSSFMIFFLFEYLIARSIKQSYDYYTRHKISEALKKYGIIFCRLTQTQKEAITILVTQSRYQFHTYAKNSTLAQKQELCQWQFYAALTEIYFGKAPTRYLLSRFYKRTGLKTINH